MKWIEHCRINHELDVPEDFPIRIWVCAAIAAKTDPIRSWNTNIYFCHQKRCICYESPTKEAAKEKARDFLAKLKCDIDLVLNLGG